MLYASKGVGMLSLPVKRVCAGMLYAFKGAHTLFTGQRGRERKREGEREIGREIEIDR